MHEHALHAGEFLLFDPGGSAALLAVALFLAGLTGGVVHCAGMCGPFVLGQVAAGLDRVGRAGYGTLARLRGAVLLPYHLGRITTYAGLGAAAGALGGLAEDVAWLRPLLPVALALAAAMFALQAVGALGHVLPARLGAGLPWGRAVARVAAPLLADPRGMRGYALGVALGFLPCGLLYAALAAAAGSGAWSTGLVAMAAFALGTMPALVGVGTIGVLFGRGILRTARAAAPLVLLANAGVLAAMAWTTA